MVNHKQYQYGTYHRLYIGHGMIQTSPDHAYQLSTKVDGLHTSPLVIPAIPFLGTPLHLGSVVGSKGDTFETTTSSDQSRRNEVLEG